LRYGGAGRSFRGVTSAAAETVNRVVETIDRVQLDLPRDCKRWLEEEAVRRKYEFGATRKAMSPIVAELIRAAMGGNGEEPEG